jgi:acetyltransferase
MMERTRIYTALRGVRGRKAVDLDGLEQLLARFSQLVAEQPWIKELDINPLLASPERLLALDARVVLHDLDIKGKNLPHLAIRPYPSQYVSTWTARDGTQITIRPIRAEDEPLLVQFHKTLSDRSVYLRFMHPMLMKERAAHVRLSRICHGDYSREITLVADRQDASGDELRILGASRMTRMHGANHARFSVLVSDRCQGMGVGFELVRRLIDVARQEQIELLEAVMTADNQVMRRLCEKVGFRFTQTKDGMLKAEMDLVPQ